jgi:hypothetical protein
MAGFSTITSIKEIFTSSISLCITIFFLVEAIEIKSTEIEARSKGPKFMLSII